MPVRQFRVATRFTCQPKHAQLFSNHLPFLRNPRLAHLAMRIRYTFCATKNLHVGHITPPGGTCQEGAGLQLHRVPRAPAGLLPGQPLPHKPLLVAGQFRQLRGSFAAGGDAVRAQRDVGHSAG